MEALVFGFLYLLAFMAGAVMCYLMMSRLAVFAAEPDDMPAEQMDIVPEMEEKLKKQYDNMFRYNGTERGQMSIE